jgi:hypothetical protein
VRLSRLKPYKPKVPVKMRGTYPLSRSESLEIADIAVVLQTAVLFCRGRRDVRNHPDIKKAYLGFEK